MKKYGFIIFWAALVISGVLHVNSLVNIRNEIYESESRNKFFTAEKQRLAIETAKKYKLEADLLIGLTFIALLFQTERCWKTWVYAVVGLSLLYWEAFFLR